MGKKNSKQQQQQNVTNALPRKPNTATMNEKQNRCNKEQSRKIKN